MICLIKLYCVLCHGSVRLVRMKETLSQTLSQQPVVMNSVLSIHAFSWYYGMPRVREL